MAHSRAKGTISRSDRSNYYYDTQYVTAYVQCIARLRVRMQGAFFWRRLDHARPEVAFSMRFLLGSFLHLGYSTDWNAHGDALYTTQKQ